MIIARQSTARTIIVGPVMDASGVAVTDGVVADFKVSKNGAAPAALNGSATLTHRNTGHYSLALTASDLDTVGTAAIVIDDTVNACPMKEITVVEEAVYDALFAASAAGYQVPIWAAANSTVNLSATTVATVATVSGSVGSVTGNVGGNVTGSVGSVAAGGITASSIAADAIGASELAADAVTEIAGGVWDLLTSGHTTSGTFGAAMNAAGSAGDPWSTNLPGTYGAGTAGSILGLTVPTIQTLIGTPLGTSVSFDINSLATKIGSPSNLGGGSSVAANLIDVYNSTPTTAENAAAVLAAGDIDGYTLEQFGKLCLAALAGKLSGAATTSVVIRAADNSKDRITATVTADGDRTAVTLDATG